MTFSLLIILQCSLRKNNLNLVSIKCCHHFHLFFVSSTFLRNCCVFPINAVAISEKKHNFFKLLLYLHNDLYLLFQLLKQTGSEHIVRLRRRPTFTLFLQFFSHFISFFFVLFFLISFFFYHNRIRNVRFN